jgi:hypothetical protein
MARSVAMTIATMLQGLIPFPSALASKLTWINLKPLSSLDLTTLAADGSGEGLGLLPISIKQ